jgi:hypothetical protein
MNGYTTCNIPLKSAGCLLCDGEGRMRVGLRVFKIFVVKNTDQSGLILEPRFRNRLNDIGKIMIYVEILESKQDPKYYGISVGH